VGIHGTATKALGDPGRDILREEASRSLGAWTCRLESNSIPRYNLEMNRSAAEILEDARQLPPGDLDWLIQNLLSEGDGASEEEAYAAWQKDVGEPEPGYEEWFRAGVEEALADTSPDTPHEEAMQQFHNAILRARKVKATA
jgi:hypothetical protein